VRVTKYEGDSFNCDVFVFDVKAGYRMVLQCSNLHFHEVEYSMLERALGKTNAAPVARAAPKAVAASAKAAAPTAKKTKKVKRVVKKKVSSGGGASVLDALLGAIAAETGTDLAELTDDAVLSELGVDSIMAIQIAATVKNTTGFDVPGTFVFEYPSIGDLRKEFASAVGEGGDGGDEEVEVEEEIDDEIEETDKSTSPAAVAAPAKKESSGGPTVLDTLLHAIAAETGTDMNELTDDAALGELGVDSIMAIQIAATVKNETGFDIPGTFVFEFPSIGDLRREYGSAESSSSVGSSSGRSSPVQDDTDVTDADEPAPTPAPASAPEKKAPTTAVQKVAPGEDSLVKDFSVFKFEEEDQENIDYATVPKAKIVLMQGKPSSGETPLFLIPDGSGTAATYIHLPPFQSGLPVYAIESPFLRCPGKLSRKTGIPGMAKLIVEAILKLRPEGPYLIGGYSGGATISYEVTRQLTATGRKIQGLLLIDMCCPRSMVDTIDSIPEQGLAILMRLSPPDKRSFWTSSMASQFAQQHQRQIVRAVCHYDPPPMDPKDYPNRVALIWGKRGLIERAKSDPKVLGMMSKLNVETETVGGFMMDPRIGPVAWSVPNKKESDLGYNGWDKFVGKDIKIMVADADHLSMPVPPDVSCPHPYPVAGLMMMMMMTD
jgi:acyl carrier protein